MFDNQEWILQEGEGNVEDLTLLSLSTCGFCSNARNYLKDRGLAFRYLELDKLDPDVKSEIKAEFRSKFGRRPSFPSLIIDSERFLIGFIKVQWDEEVRPKAL